MAKLSRKIELAAFETPKLICKFGLLQIFLSVTTVYFESVNKWNSSVYNFGKLTLSNILKGIWEDLKGYIIIKVCIELGAGGAGCTGEVRSVEEAERGRRQSQVGV